MARMETEMTWFRDLSAEDRSWVGLIVQAGIRGFVDWYRHEGDHPLGGSALAASVFGAAPRALAGVINLQQTVDLVRLSIEVVESNIDAILDPADAPEVHAAVLRYAREVAFATAEVYARAAEVRGAWTPGWRPSSWTRCCARRRTRRCSPGPARWAGAPVAT
jgi:hypothetical protein